MSARSAQHSEEMDSFYSDVLTQAERMRLYRARQGKGLDEEIALLRVRISRLVKEQPDKLELLIKGIRLLVQAISTTYRLSPQANEDLTGNITAVLEGIGTALWPEGTGGI